MAFKSSFAPTVTSVFITDLDEQPSRGNTEILDAFDPRHGYGKDENPATSRIEKENWRVINLKSLTEVQRRPNKSKVEM